MKNVKWFLWCLTTMSPWIFKHAYHAGDHQVDSYSIEKNFEQGYFRCRRCQAHLTVPKYYWDIHLGRNA